MNNPEVTMHEFRSCRGFQAHEKAVEAAGIAIGLALKVSVPDGARYGDLTNS
ncbi:MAG TPA: hypothetical protein VLT32_06395 [Candidatus Sulfomarinibacteraceae bacterium]|nr:hypothetical protein [Candidatus Sulfomarinibacteraceae bacterium]